MKRILIPAALALLTTLYVGATTPGLTSITQPLYYLGSAGGAKIQYIKTPKILNNASAMFWVELFASPTVPKGAREDLNLISIYGIKVQLGRQDRDGRVKEIVVDIAMAKKDQRYPFTILQSAHAAIRAVRLEFPKEDETRILLKNGDKILERHPKA